MQILQGHTLKCWWCLLPTPKRLCLVICEIQTLFKSCWKYDFSDEQSGSIKHGDYRHIRPSVRK